MNTTDNENAPKAEPVKRDDKAMKEAYGKGETIDSLAETYGLTPQEVETVVVTPVKGDTDLPTQAELDGETTKGKE